MAKNKKSGDTISSRLALVMKSGKGESISHDSKVCIKPLTLPSHHGLQVYHEDPSLRQGQTHPYCWQLPSSAQVRTRVLRHARQDPRAPLQRQQRTSTLPLATIHVK